MGQDYHDTSSITIFSFNKKIVLLKVYNSKVRTLQRHTINSLEAPNSSLKNNLRLDQERFMDKTIMKDLDQARYLIKHKFYL